MKCIKCGKEINKKFKVCPNCGEPIKSNQIETKKISWLILTTILIIGIFSISIGIYLYFFKGESIDKIRKSVVKINVYDKSGELYSTGSGFVAYDKNILITNAHVITGGYNADAVSESDERLYIKGVLYYSQDEDIAILKLNNQNSIKPLNTNSNYKVGDKVIAIGSPLGIKNSVSDGMLSNILKDEDNKIQHTAPISPGNSGGALFNKKGQVIGMNTLINTAGQNINLAIPISDIEKAYNKSKNKKTQKINKVQMNNDKKIKSILLNNNAGNSIIKITKQIDNKATSIFNTIKSLKRVPALKYIYENKEYFSDVLVISGYDDIEIIEKPIENCGTTLDGQPLQCIDEDSILKSETKLPEFTLIKVNNMTEELYQVIKEMFEERKEILYETATLPPDKTVYPNNKYSIAYQNSIVNATIGYYGNYAYMIMCKDDNYKEEVEKLIKQLPL